MLNHHEVKRRREEMKLSLSRAADAAGFKGYQQWWNLENGKSPMPRLDTLLALADVLGCSVAEIIVEKHKPQAAGKRRRVTP